MVSSINALRTYLRLTYGKVNILRTERSRFNPDELFVTFRYTDEHKVEPKQFDFKVYNCVLLETDEIQGYRIYRYQLSTNTTPNRKFAIPTRFHTCLRVFQTYPERLEIIKTEMIVDSHPKQYAQSLKYAKVNKECQYEYGTYDIIQVRCKDEMMEKYVRERADYRIDDIYSICFLRRYRARGTDSITQRNEKAKWLTIYHLYLLLVNSPTYTQGYLDSETKASQMALEEMTLDFYKMSVWVENLVNSYGKNCL